MTESFDIPFTGTQPVQAHPGDAGADLVSAISLTLAPGERATLAYRMTFR